MKTNRFIHCRSIKFTKRQIEVLRLLSKGLPNKEIGNIMHITESSAKQYITILNKKLETKSRAQLMAWCYCNADMVDPYFRESEKAREISDRKLSNNEELPKGS